MLLFGVNFNLYYLILIKQFRTAIKSTELWVYGAIVFISGIVISVDISRFYNDFGDAVRHAFFQVSSVMTTTGFATTDFNLWPELSRMTLLLAMCIGACAGSTGGGFKISRLVILWKEGRRQIKRAVTPNRVEMVHFNGKPLSQSILSGVCGYLVLYVILIAVSIFLVSFDRMDITTNVTAVLATVNNIGPGLSVVGPTGNFSGFSIFSKCVLIFDMLAGRLEIIPVFALFARRTWRS
jgi:trk system potassium uptake protein TrkH